MAWRGPASKKVTNQAPNQVSHGNDMSGEKKTIPDAGFPFYENRALQVRRDKDKEKNFGVSLIDIDSTILTYMDTVINPTIVDAGRQVKVPINYASPERWKAIRKDGAIRDKNGKMQCPAIAFRRSTMQRNDGLITLNRYLQYPVLKNFSEKNKYDKFSVMNGFSPLKEAYSVAMADHVIINYDFIVWTELIEQGNAIVEGINFSTEDYWGDKARYKFRTSISDYNFETTVDAGSDRMVKTTFSLMVYAYLLPDKYENYKSVVEKAFTTRKVVVNFDAVVDGNFNQKPVQSLDLFSVGGSSRTSFGAFDGRYPSFPSIVTNADHSFTADFAVNAGTSSFFSASGSVQLGGLILVGNGATGSFTTNLVNGVSTSEAIDTVAFTVGNAAKWFVSINDGGSNFKTTEVMAAWPTNGSAVRFYTTEVNQIGTVPVTLSVNNAAGNIHLYANVLAGTWTIKYIRTIV